MLAPAAEAARRPAPPAAIFAYYASASLGRLLTAIERSGLPPGARVFFGNTQGTISQGRPVPALPRPLAPSKYAYAPVFPAIRYTTYWQQRRLGGADARAVDRVEGRGRRGALPSLGALLSTTRAERLRWGRELGRRFRDKVRARRRQGVAVTTWQLDEIVSEAGGPSGARYRQLLQGILEGVRSGRAELGDRPERGIVWATRAGLSASASGAFWAALERASTLLVGEEYVSFTGDPRAAARSSAGPQRRLRGLGRTGALLAGRYVAGLTPGYDLQAGLGGNVAGRSRGWVRRWRDAYVGERARIGVAGFAMWQFLRANGTPGVVREATLAVGRGVRLLERLRQATLRRAARGRGRRGRG